MVEFPGLVGIVRVLLSSRSFVDFVEAVPAIFDRALWVRGGCTLRMDTVEDDFGESGDSHVQLTDETREVADDHRTNVGEIRVLDRSGIPLPQRKNCPNRDLLVLEMFRQDTLGKLRGVVDRERCPGGVEGDEILRFRIRIEQHPAEETQERDSGSQRDNPIPFLYSLPSVRPILFHPLLPSSLP